MSVSHKTVSVLLATAVAAAAFAACGSGDGKPLAASEESSNVAAATPGAVRPTFSSEGFSGSPLQATAPSSADKALNTNQGASKGGSGDLPEASADFARKVIVNANMSLNVKDVVSAFAEANRLARSAGGYVEKSSFANVSGDRDDSRRAANITLRIPSAQYDATLASLRGIDGAQVLSEGSKSSEVTEQYTDLQSRLRNLERTETQYLKLLEQAKTMPEILQLQDRLDSVRGQIEQIQGRLKVLDQLVDFTTIDVALAPFPLPTVGAGDSASLTQVFSTAWEQSVTAARYIAAFAIYAGVASMWLALPVGLAFLFFRRANRKEASASAAP